MEEIIISAGGTGGHLVPAQQLAANLMKSNYKITFVAHGLKNNHNFDKRSFNYKDINSSSINKKKLFSALFRLCKGTFSSLKLFIRKRPKIIIGFGSYHTFPVVFAARLLNIPFVLFESNATLGRVNTFFAKKAHATAYTFLQNKNLKKSEKVILLPWNRDSIKASQEEARDQLGISKDLPTILVFGGSSGANFINEIFLKASFFLKEKGCSFQVIHLCGKNVSVENIKRVYKKNGIISYVSTYEKDMSIPYIAADFVVCRAGASTISELIYYEKPSVLIPYPFASGLHQDENANFMKKVVNSSEVFFQSSFDFNYFIDTVLQLIKKDKKYSCYKNNVAKYKHLIEGEKRKSLQDIIFDILR